MARRKRSRRQPVPARLLAATGTPIELTRRRNYVLGRGRDCDIVIEDLLSSRHHARISVADAIAITDLDSRNGTFVNDSRIESETPLPHGSRVRIGASVFLVSTAAATPDPLDTGTVALEHMMLGGAVDEGILRSLRDEGAQGGLTGQLDAISLVDILQGILRAGGDGTLHVALPAGPARVEVRRGEVIDASCGEQRGLDALVALARERVGVFWLGDADADCERTIDEPNGRLLYRLCCALE